MPLPLVQCPAPAQEASAIAGEQPRCPTATSDIPERADPVSRAPALTVERYDEDWSALADARARTGRWTERFKYLPLNSDGSVYITTGIEVRARSESYSAPSWGAAPDFDYVWTRVMPYADVHVGSVRFFVQPLAAHVIGRAPPHRPADRTGTDVLQALAEFELTVGASGSLRTSVGRQLVSLGGGRLIDTRYGPNVPMPFDGLQARFETTRAKVTMFDLRPVETGPHDFDDRGSSRRRVWGVYGAIWREGSRETGTDLYYIGFRDRRAVFEQGAARELLHTFGVREFGQHGPGHWNVEGVLQSGSFGHASVSAWGLGMEIGRRFDSTPFRPDLTLILDIASGDRDPARKTLQTFNPLFPRGKYFGALSPVGPRNVIHLNPSLALHPAKRVGLSLAASAFWRQSRRDGVYGIAGDLVRRGGSSRDRFVGSQFEAAGSLQLTPELSLSTSLSAFAPGAFIRATGPARTTLMSASTISFRF